MISLHAPALSPHGPAVISLPISPLGCARVSLPTRPPPRRPPRRRLARLGPVAPLPPFAAPIRFASTARRRRQSVRANGYDDDYDYDYDNDDFSRQHTAVTKASIRLGQHSYAARAQVRPIIEVATDFDIHYSSASPP